MLTTCVLLVALQADPAITVPDDGGVGVALDEQRVKRFVGALVGSVVGLAIPLAISAPSCGAGGFTCATGFQNFTLGIMPLIAGLGGYFGHHLMGGGAEYPFAVLGASIGSLLGMLALTFAQQTGTTPGLGLLPMAGSAAGLTAFLMAFLLDQRDQAIGQLPEGAHATGARLWAMFGVGAGLLVPGAFISVLLSAASGLAGAISSLLFVAALPLAVWGVHQAMGGRGSLLAAFLGLLVGVAGVAAIGVPLVSVASASSPTSFYAVQQAALVTGAAFVGVFLAPAIAVELSHTGVVGEALNGPKATLSFAPVAGGGMLSGGIRF